jgi:hypothetical protein
VWPVGAAEAEAGAHVVEKVGLLLDGGQESLVDGLLVLNTVLGSLLLLYPLSMLLTLKYECSTHLGGLALLEESILSRLLGGLVLGEVAILGGLLQNGLIHAIQIHLGRSGDDIAGIYPSQGNAIDFERTGDEEDALGKVLEENNTLATEAASEENDDGTRLEGSPGFGRTQGLAGLGSYISKCSQFEVERPN